jgi:hypothetical protein
MIVGNSMTQKIIIIFTLINISPLVYQNALKRAAVNDRARQTERYTQAYSPFSLKKINRNLINNFGFLSEHLMCCIW